MTTAEQINRNVNNMPPSFQQEVLDFVEFLLQKRVNKDKDWSDFSLAQAMRGMENDEMSEYTDDDLIKTTR